MANFIILSDELIVNEDTISNIRKAEQGDYSLRSYYDKTIIVTFKDGVVAKFHFYEDEEQRNKEYNRIVKKLTLEVLAMTG